MGEGTEFVSGDSPKAAMRERRSGSGQCWLLALLGLGILYAFAAVMLFTCMGMPPRVSFEWTTMNDLLRNFTEAANDLENFAGGINDQASKMMPCDDSTSFEEACRNGQIDTTDDETGLQREKVCREGGTGMSKCEQGLCTALTVSAVGSAGCSWVPFAGGVCNTAAKVLKIVFSSYRFTSKLTHGMARLRYSMPQLKEAMQVIGGTYAVIACAVTVVVALILTCVAVLACQKGHDQDKNWAITGLIVTLLAINGGVVYAQEVGLLDLAYDVQVGEFEVP